MIWAKQIMKFHQVLEPETVSVLIRYMKKVKFENAGVGPVKQTVNKKVRNVK